MKVMISQPMNGLTDEEIKYLDELYVKHPIVGAINKNPDANTILLDEKK